MTFTVNAGVPEHQRLELLVLTFELCRMLGKLRLVGCRHRADDVTGILAAEIRKFCLDLVINCAMQRETLPEPLRAVCRYCRNYKVTHLRIESLRRCELFVCCRIE